MTRPIIEYIDLSKPEGEQHIRREMTDAEFEAYQEKCAKADAEQAEKEATEYQVKRAAEYPPIGDQLDALMKWLSTESEFSIPAELKSIAMSCMSVKAKYPKPTEEK